MRYLVLVLLHLLVAISGAATPNRKPDKEEPKSWTPSNVSGPTNWGYLYQDGASITIDGHDRWYAVGRIHRDGRIEVHWTERQTKRPAHSIYRVFTKKDGEKVLQGWWGWADECFVNNKGELEPLADRSIMRDVVWKVKQ